MSYRSLMKFHLKDYRRGALILLSILVCVDIAFVLLMKLFPALDMGSADSIFSVNRNIMSIFMLVSMIVTVAITFPLMSSFSVTRRDFYFSSLLAVLAFCITAALAESAIYLIGRAVLPAIGLPVDVGRPLASSAYEFGMTLLDISVVTFLIGGCFYRFKIIIGIISANLYFFSIALIARLFPSLEYMQDSVIFSPSEFTRPGTTLLMWAIIALCVTAGWFVYRRTDVRM
ncbi:hypothetical protein [Paenibacillus sp. MMS20-IR301]|uniref:hypothetical protein n=1 Tax=Paenibacillus sp. MMS20-IR301 TaxID=2895946 RepID=UPI0028EF8B77|nr:hypothetical protein [Paenibacillus sp. MMS20-IR301]WNS43331.1 hypothetical protein LOS79_31080 [Paenibacillus sp. MMS20-IR301]